MPRASSPQVVVFLGPSLPAAEARRIAPGCLVLPPARQGDVWRAIERRPRVIALIDGVFEAQPSVWHHELLAAIDAGIAVVGGGSMGALRAAELHALGMVGVGRIFEGFRDGELIDDSEVALLHADAEHDFRALTVPLVNVRHAAKLAAAKRILTAREARTLVATAQRCFYQERSWPRLLRDVNWPEPVRERFRVWLERTRPDLKAEDARAVLRKAVSLARRPSAGARLSSAQSSLVRQRRLLLHADALAAFRSHSDAAGWRDAGLRRALLAGWARTRGLGVSARALREERARWLRGLGIRRRDEESFLRSLALDEAQLLRLLEDVLLERQVLERAQRMLPDGPSADEALVAEARLRGLWPRPGR